MLRSVLAAISARTLALVIGLALVAPAAAAPPVRTADLDILVTTWDGTPLSAVTVRVEGTTLGAFTDAAGRARIAGVPAGERTLRAERPGYRTLLRTVDVRAGETLSVRIQLELVPVTLDGISVSLLRPDLRPEVSLDDAALREAILQDIGGAFRILPGLDAVRRGALGLEPVVRGLRDTQVGAYVDGMRTLPGGPGGMDTPLSHVDPSAVRGVEVVKGPYALTWGAGNMSAVRVQTAPLPGPDAPPVSARAMAGFQSNLNASEGALELGGAIQGVGYLASGAWREGENYRSGDGTEVPARFTSGELRGRLGFETGPGSELSLSGWLQDQRDIDYPGRPLDAEYFDAWNAAIRYTRKPASGALRSLEGQLYLYAVDHSMNNDRKPTAQPNPNRTPPAPLEIITDSRVEMVGGRVAALVAPATPWAFEIGADGYSALHNADRRTWNRSTGQLMGTGLIWGNARLTHLGSFARVERGLGRLNTSATVRLDWVDARADTASAFFLANASSALDARETNWSGAVTVGLPVGPHWVVSAGAGSVARSPDANERYSDRAPSKRAQIGAEFLGNPALRPERSHQLDLWIETDHPRWNGSLNLFAQRIDDYITLERTTLPRASALSAPMVFRYVNGSARYVGAEATGAVALLPRLLLSGAVSLLRGEDQTLDEPTLGVSPPRADVVLRWDGAAGRPTRRLDSVTLEAQLRAVARQERVSDTRGEIVTPGYSTLEVSGGLPLTDQVRLRMGVSNVFDREVTHHLNARNPFSGATIPEPGRVLFVRLTSQF
jgi:iron complex outermembrane recepter protein